MGCPIIYSRGNVTAVRCGRTSKQIRFLAVRRSQSGCQTGPVDRPNRDLWPSCELGYQTARDFSMHIIRNAANRHWATTSRYI